MSDKNTAGTQYWYNTETGQVEESTDRSAWTHRMGPYPTRAAAEQALDKAARRNDSWDDADADWRYGR